MPTAAPTTGDTFSAVWIGIGGQYDTSLIQCGTEQDFFGGQAMYSAWYELLPRSSSTVMRITISPGDLISASIQLVNAAASQWTINLTDVTNGQSFQTSVLYASSQLSAEWIVERPLVGRVLAPLANVGTVTMTNCTATINGVTGSISSFPSTEVVMYSSASFGGYSTQLTNVSSLSPDGSSFSVTYLASS